MSNNSHFRGKKEPGKRDQTLLKSERQHLYHIYWSIWKQLSCKKSVLVIWKILRLFVNTLTANDKYSLLNRENLTKPIQMQLSQKQKTFHQFFSQFLKFTLNFKHFQKKDVPHSWSLSESTDSIKQVKSMSNNSSVRDIQNLEIVC